MDKLIYEKMNEKHLEDVLELLLLCFPEEEISYRKYKHIHFDNPISNYQPVGYVAKSNNEVVGYRGFVPLQYSFAGEIMKVLVPANTAVHPDFRGKGVFSKLVKISLEELYKDYTYFFNISLNSRSIPANLKSGYQILGSKDYLIKKYIFGTKRKIPMSYSIIKPVEFDWMIIKNIYERSILKDSDTIRVSLESKDFINWIFNSFDVDFLYLEKNNEIVAYISYKIINNVCEIIHFDMLNDKGSLSYLISAISHKHKITTFHCFTSKNNNLRNYILNKNMFFKTNYALIRKIFKRQLMPILIRPTKEKFDETDFVLKSQKNIIQFNNWDITSLSYF